MDRQFADVQHLYREWQALTEGIVAHESPTLPTHHALVSGAGEKALYFRLLREETQHLDPATRAEIARVFRRIYAAAFALAFDAATLQWRASYAAQEVPHMDDTLNEAMRLFREAHGVLEGTGLADLFSPFLAAMRRVAEQYDRLTRTLREEEEV